MSKKIIIQSHKGHYEASFKQGGIDHLTNNLVKNAVYIIDRNICKLYEDRISKILTSQRIIKIDAFLKGSNCSMKVTKSGQSGSK